MNVFEVSHVTYRYDAVAALADVTLAIPAGKRVALLGANGSGKSTLLRLLDGLHFADSGTVSFHGRALNADAFGQDAFAFDFRRRVGLVFQNPEVQLFNPTVFDEVAFAPLQLRWPKEQIVERVSAVLDRMEIGHLRSRPPHRLSGGEKKRVALASVLVLDPEGPAARRADRRTRSPQREPDHRHADRLGRRRAHRDHGHARPRAWSRTSPTTASCSTKERSRRKASRRCCCATRRCSRAPT